MQQSQRILPAQGSSARNDLVSSPRDPLLVQLPEPTNGTLVEGKNPQLRYMLAAPGSRTQRVTVGSNNRY